MPRRPDNANLTLAAAVIVASGLIHGVMWPLGDKVLELSWKSPPLPRASGVMEVALITPNSAEDPPEELIEVPEEPEAPDELDEIVQLDRIVDERPPDETHHRSEFDNRVDKETKAPNRRPTPGAAPQIPGRPQSQPNESPPNPRPNPNARSLQLGTRGQVDDERGRPLDEADNGRMARGTQPRQGSVVPPRAGMLGSPEALKKTFGSPGTLDALKDVEEGEENVLNSRRYKYASFFNRVRNSVAQHWKPAEVHRAHDPDGRIFGAKTRRTNLVIRLNADGSLAKIMTVDRSEAPHLDEEAIRAVRQAAPFDNPPAGLVDPNTGFIEFHFGFIFELRGKKRIFRYQR
ncbi:MAG: energy transducer TonB [Myxococcota bacterium]